MIIDDYGHWKGVRQAVDQYIKENYIQIFLDKENKLHRKNRDIGEILELKIRKF